MGLIRYQQDKRRNRLLAQQNRLLRQQNLDAKLNRISAGGAGCLLPIMAAAIVALGIMLI